MHVEKYLTSLKMIVYNFVILREAVVAFYHTCTYSMQDCQREDSLCM